MRIGIDLGGTKIEGIVLRDNGQVAEKIRVPTPGQNYEKIVATVCDVINQLQQAAPSRLKVGIGTPGALSKNSGLMKNCNSICLNGNPLQQDIEDKLGYGVKIENDANCFALSEACYGSAAAAGSMFGVIIGTGCGGGVVIQKRLVSGPNSIAGEWGHNSLPSSARSLIRQDRICYCGRSNCIETVLSGRDMSQTHQELTGDLLSAQEIAANAEDGNEAAESTLRLYADQLGRCLATIINVLDPEVIVLGGGLSNIGALYRLTPTLWSSYIFTDKVHTKLLPPQHGDASGALGAACLWPLD